MPLCPSCIGEHSVYHHDVGNQPQYFSVDRVMDEAATNIGNTIQHLEQARGKTVRLERCRGSSFKQPSYRIKLSQLSCSRLERLSLQSWSKC